jgi:hypothetical protein
LGPENSANSSNFGPCVEIYKKFLGPNHALYGPDKIYLNISQNISSIPKYLNFVITFFLGIVQI